MKFSIEHNNIKLELNNKQQLFEVLELLYSTKTAFQVELNFTDYDATDASNRYVRCYLILDSNEEAAKFAFKLMEIKDN
jgi:hypothetical protein